MKNGEIVLNVSTTATRKLTIDNEWIQFTARFNGASQEVAVPIGAVIGIFAKETGYGFAFNAPDDPAASLAPPAARGKSTPAEGRQPPRKRHRTSRSSSSAPRARVAHAAFLPRRPMADPRAALQSCATPA